MASAPPTLVHRDTLACVLRGCVPCGYKVVLDAGPDAIPNQRPETCLREQDRRQASQAAEESKRGLKRIKGWKKEEKRQFRKKRRLALKQALLAAEESDESDEAEGPNATAEESLLANLGWFCRGDCILTVGDGDMSFSLAIAEHLDHGGLVATTYEPLERLKDVYPNFEDVTRRLRDRGVDVRHDVDGASLEIGDNAPFDHIVWNFPCVAVTAAGEPHKGTNQDGQLSELESNKRLLSAFFCASKSRLKANGSVHISHKTKAPFSYWNIPDIANECGFVLEATLLFDRTLFPGYMNRKALVAEGFPVTDAVTYVFTTSSCSERRKVAPSAESIQEALARLGEATAADSIDLPYIESSPALLLDITNTLLRKPAAGASEDDRGAPESLSASHHSNRLKNPFALLQTGEDSDEDDG